MFGIKITKTTASHSLAYEKIERLHRQLKSALMYNNGWVEILPVVLLEICAAIKEELKATSAELMYREHLSLPDAKTEKFCNRIMKK